MYSLPLGRVKFRVQRQGIYLILTPILVCCYRFVFSESPLFLCSLRHCLASPANFIYGRVLAKVLSHVTIMPVLLRPVNNFLGQVIGNASDGKYNTVNNSLSGEVTFQKCLKSGNTLFSSKNSRTFANGHTMGYMKLGHAA